MLNSIGPQNKLNWLKVFTMSRNNDNPNFNSSYKNKKGISCLHIASNKPKKRLMSCSTININSEQNDHICYIYTSSRITSACYLIRLGNNYWGCSSSTLLSAIKRPLMQQYGNSHSNRVVMSPLAMNRQPLYKIIKPWKWTHPCSWLNPLKY